MSTVAPPVWSGRDDGPGAPHRRWHTTIRPLAEASAPGVTLVGFRSDEGVRRNKGRTGAAEGPGALRRALAPLALHRDGGLHDGGDVAVEDGDLEAGQERLGTAVAAALAAGHLPIVLGGGHEVAYGSYVGIDRGLGTRRQRTLGVLNLDAHFDLRDEAVATSGTPFLQMARSERDRGRELRYAVAGISETANTAALFDRAAALDARYLADDECAPAESARVRSFVTEFLASVDDVHLSLDLDVLPGWVAPGVSAPAAMGVAPEIVQMVIDIVARSGKLALFDVAELNPGLDADGRTARLAARLVDRVATAGSRA